MPKPLASGGQVTSAFLNDLVGVIDRSTSAVDVVNTVTETSVYSKAVAAAAMSTDRLLRLTLIGDYLNDSGATRTFTVRFKFGGVTLLSSATPAIVQSATRRPIRIAVEIANLGATNAQQASAMFMFGAAPSGFAASGAFDGVSVGIDEYTFGTFGAATGAIDTTAAATLDVTVEHSTNNASLSFRKKHALLELL